MPIPYHTAKGLFAEAERLAYGDDRPTLVTIAAHIALSNGIIHKDNDYGDLADVEAFLRSTGSNYGLFARPRLLPLTGARLSATYSWLPASAEGSDPDDPQYVLQVFDQELIQRNLRREDIHYGENIRRLALTGLPPLVPMPLFEERLSDIIPLAEYWRGGFPLQ